MGGERQSTGSDRDTSDPQGSHTESEDALSKLIDRVRTAHDEEARWHLLLDAVVTMAAGLSLDDLLTRIVRISGELVGAKYAALGVVGSAKDRRLRTFVVEGLTEGEATAIGELPRGHGLLGLLIDRPEPVRLNDIAKHPESFGFPEHHPPMHSFLGAPIRTGEKVFGNLYLTEKAGGGQFTDEDEGVLVALASAAGVAIENVRLHEEAARRQRWLAATSEITTGLLAARETEEGLQLVADKARELSGADFAWIITGPDADRLRLRVASGIELSQGALMAVSLEHSVAGTAIHTCRPITVEDMSREVHASDFGVLPLPELGPAMMFPLRDVHGDAGMATEGVLVLSWRHTSADAAGEVDIAMPAAFAEQAALAIRLARGRSQGQRLAVYEDRERIGRDLHDVVIQHLFSIGLGLQGTLHRADDSQLVARLDEAVQEIDDTIADIRRTIFSLSATDEAADLQTQVARIADGVSRTLKFRPQVAFEGPVRIRVNPAIIPDLLAVLREALSNAARHAHASRIQVLVRVTEMLSLRVADDGVGIPVDATTSGLANMRERAVKHGGRCTITAAQPTGTIVEWAVPLT